MKRAAALLLSITALCAAGKPPRAADLSPVLHGAAGAGPVLDASVVPAETLARVAPRSGANAFPQPLHTPGAAADGVVCRRVLERDALAARAAAAHSLPQLCRLQI